MGLIVPQTLKVRASTKMCKYYKEKGYEFKKCGDFIEVDVMDLYPGSHEKVKIICDICGNESKIEYRHFVEDRKNGVLVSCKSKYCRHKKCEDTCIKRYGVKYAAQSQEIQNKAKKTWQKNYGEGIINPFQAESVRDKIKKTWQENHGEYITSPFQLESIREKSQQTLQKNYGENIINPMQVEDIKNKRLSSFQFNSTGPCSRVQKYIHFLIGGVLNKRVCNFLVDICFEKEKTAIEYDGSGHFLRELIINKDRSISKEAFLKEKQREDKIINNGYRMIRFIATKDRIPSDEVVLNLIEGFKNSDFKVIRINFEEGTIDRDYEEKWYCNFGELRRIAKEDLEQFEKQEENTSEN